VTSVPSPLQSPELRRIIAAYAVNRLGTWFGFIALSVAVFDHTHSALAVAALLVAGQALPAFVVPAVVARVETSARRAALSALYLFEGVATSALAVVLLWHFWLPGMLLLVALDGTAALAASALLRAETARAARSDVEARATADGRPDNAPDDAETAERKANAALNVAFSGTFVLGPVLGGALVATAGAPAALFVDTASFLICGAMLLDLRPQVEQAGTESVRMRLRAAWAHINEVRALRMLLLAEAVALVFFESAAPIEVAYAKATLHAGDRGYGLLVTVWGAGVVVGSLAFARAFRRPLGAMLSAGTLAVGLAYVGFAAAPSLLLACLAALLGGVGNGVQWASLISAVQRLTPQRLLARMMGAVESIGAISPAVGLSLGGALVALASPRTAFLVVGLGATATTAAFVGLAIAQSGPPADAESERPETWEQLYEPTPQGPGVLVADGRAMIERSEGSRPASETTP
jgi:MFS family permease